MIKLLSRLFDQIDIDSKQYITWEEFSGFLVNQASVINKHLVSQQTGENRIYTITDVKHNKKLLDVVQNTTYIPDLDMIALMQEKHSVITFISPKDASIVGVPLNVIGTGSKNVSNKLTKDASNKKSVLSIVYIAEYKLLVISTDDKMLRFWQYHMSNFVEPNTLLASESMFKNKGIECKKTQYCLVWDTYHKVLYSGQEDGVINQWSIKDDESFLGVFEGPTRKELKEMIRKTEGDAQKAEGDSEHKIEEKKWRQKHYDEEEQTIRHFDAITDLLALPKLLFLASASLDQKVILWDTITRKARRVYTAHKKGVNALAYSEDLIMLFSAGYDHEICIWNPYIDHLIYKITGHSNAITSLCIMSNNNQLVSGDIDGFIKVWNLKNMACLQTINVQLQMETFKFELRKVIAIEQFTKIIAVGRKIFFYDYDKDYNPKLIDKFMPLCIDFHPETLEFIVPVGKSLKIWDALTGKVKKMYKNVTSSDITLFLFDEKFKRFLVGDAEGNLLIYNYYTGNVMKTLSKHHGPITTAVFCSANKFLYTGSNKDKEIAIHDDRLMNQSVRIRTLRHENYYPTKFGITKEGYVVVGFTNGIVKIYENDASRTLDSFYVYQSVSYI